MKHTESQLNLLRASLRSLIDEWQQLAERMRREAKDSPDTCSGQYLLGQADSLDQVAMAVFLLVRMIENQEDLKGMLPHPIAQALVDASSPRRTGPLSAAGD